MRKFSDSTISSSVLHEALSHGQQRHTFGYPLVAEESGRDIHVRLDESRPNRKCFVLLDQTQPATST